MLDLDMYKFEICNAVVDKVPGFCMRENKSLLPHQALSMNYQMMLHFDDEKYQFNSNLFNIGQT